MQFNLDETQVEIIGTTLGEIMETALAQSELKGRIVIEVIMDDQILSHDEINALTDQNISERKIHINSANPAELAITVLNDTQVILHDTRDTQVQISQMLQSDEPAKALTQLQQVLQSWQASQEALTNTTELMEVPLDDVIVGETSAIIIINQLSEQLANMHQLLNDKDYLALADLLGYELNETADLWITLIDSLCKTIESRHLKS